MASPRPSPSSLRLQKYLALCGLGSRRACESLIESGRVLVDGQVVTQQGVCVDPQAQTVVVDGAVAKPEHQIYLLFNKPRQVLCTCSDPQGRPTFRDYMRDFGERLYTVGRLDWDSEGLLIVTNDGALTQRLAHPRHHVAKTYRVWTDRRLTRDHEAMLRQGVMSDGERLSAEDVHFERVAGGQVVYRMVLREGRKREIRRMLEQCGASVLRLQRIAIGPLTLGTLPVGRWRHMTVAERSELLRL